MKVVLFCGGQGLRIREFSTDVPKPMVHVGVRPILWHIMKYYAHFGHKDFILCLGHQGDVIKNYFLNYNECTSNDFILRGGGQEPELLKEDIHDWRITFVDTGLTASIGERLMAVRPHLQGENTFLANYADCLTDLHLPGLINYFNAQDKVGCFLSIPPSYSFHVVESRDDGVVTSVAGAKDVDIWINGGFFILKNAIFDYMRQGDDLVEAPFQRLIDASELVSYRHDGFWACMDTFKEKMYLEEIHEQGNAPWKVWGNGRWKRAPIQKSFLSYARECRG